ncbi:hypothetical protein H6G00_22140 [Leptolyngbya sp. FACHB-541]|uniref:hypothetical protein n=1 Tax=Leptolyngbya sp. FACHB-541 TaxID=2692810 RepID=UPI001686A4BC|nr:hypothetical protein [Leptolyngbya sp. FACHB-541]MBD1999278.1 hypothetical protein [Leptolyngbya sp. FACHB-541]
MDLSQPNQKITLSALVYTFVPFSILTAIGIFLAETRQDIVLERAIYSIWETYILATPALCLYILGLQQSKRYTYWLLFWTFAGLAYAIHVYWTFFQIFDGQIEKMFTKQGLAIAGTNVAITLWWMIDLALAWFVNSNQGWIRAQRTGIHTLFFLAAVFVGIFRKEGVITWLSIAMAVAVVTCIIIRIRSRKTYSQTSITLDQDGFEGLETPGTATQP